MASVGAFPTFQDFRRTIRSPVNPMDKSTVVSIYPKRIDEVKHTIQPGRFIIEPGSLKNPSILVVGSSSWWKETDPEQPLLEIPNSSIQIADSIVKDFCNGLIGCNMSDAMPGLFWLPGALTVETIKKEHFGELSRYNTYQKNYFTNLVKMADKLWATSNGNPYSISEDSRIAARELNLNDKEWLKDFHMITQVRCVACGELRNPEFPICKSCNTIVDQELWSKLNLKPVEKVK